MRHFRKSALVGVVAWAAATGALAEQTLVDRIEMLDWSDPERADSSSMRLPTSEEGGASDIQMLEVRGMVYVDVRRDSDVDATIARLQSIAQDGDEAAVLAEQYVRAYSLYQRDQYAAANAELSRVDIDSIATDTERYRVAILRGNSLRTLGQAEAALPFLERGLDVAHDMHDDPRTLHAMLWLARIYTNTGNFDRASEQLQSARKLATTLGDEAAFAEIDGCVSDIADRQGDHAAERRASLFSLEHARRSGSNKWLAHALVNLGDSYLKTRDFARVAQVFQTGDAAGVEAARQRRRADRDVQRRACEHRSRQYRAGRKAGRERDQPKPSPGTICSTPRSCCTSMQTPSSMRDI